MLYFRYPATKGYNANEDFAEKLETGLLQLVLSFSNCSKKMISTAAILSISFSFMNSKPMCSFFKY